MINFNDDTKEKKISTIQIGPNSQIMHKEY